MSAPTPRQPPIKCTPCRVKYNGLWYFVTSNGEVYPYDTATMTVDHANPRDESLAKVIRHAASRLRRNRAARERHAAMRSLGMVKTPGGWE